VGRLIADPAHPYTRALIAAVPDMRTDRSTPLATVPGQPPRIDAIPDGCAFAPRCAHTTARCLEQRPPLSTLGTGHRLACWNPQSGPAVSGPAT
jgi:peptide/nickel transport system permease protein